MFYDRINSSVTEHEPEMEYSSIVVTKALVAGNDLVEQPAVEGEVSNGSEQPAVAWEVECVMLGGDTACTLIQVRIEHITSKAIEFQLPLRRSLSSL